jgi:hypothetical protein
MVVVKTSDVQGRQRADLVRTAARNNADWCDIVCRLHGQAGVYHDGGWTVPKRSPPLYPDAVTLDPAASIDAILAAIDTSPGCSLKDSFACLNLASEGFHVLFEAQWICREADAPSPETPAGMRRERVRDPAVLRRWERAWNQPVRHTSGAVSPFAVGRGRRDRDGGLLGRGDRRRRHREPRRDRLSLTNVFSAVGDLDAAWCGSVAAVAAHMGDLPLVGYERADDLEAAGRYGFALLGPLRVWIKGALGSR